MLLPFLQTLSDSTRMQILETLKDGEKSVHEIASKVEIAQSGVSRHLKILEAAGFVKMRPLAQKRLYSLRPEPFAQIGDWANEYRKIWEARLNRFDNAVQNLPKN